MGHHLGAICAQEASHDIALPFAKPQRMFFLTVGALGAAAMLKFPGLVSAPFPLLEWILWLIAAGALVTAVRRIVRLYRQLP